MSYEMLMEKLNFVIYGENKWRLHKATVNFDGTPSITLNVHELSAKDAKRLVMNVINVLQGKVNLTIIHGYNHGTAIKDMLADENFNGRLTERYCPKRNPGLTNLQIAA